MPSYVETMAGRPGLQVASVAATATLLRPAVQRPPAPTGEGAGEKHGREKGVADEQSSDDDSSSVASDSSSDEESSADELPSNEAVSGVRASSLGEI